MAPEACKGPLAKVDSTYTATRVVHQTNTVLIETNLMGIEDHFKAFS